MRILRSLHILVEKSDKIVSNYLANGAAALGLIRNTDENEVSVSQDGFRDALLQQLRAFRGRLAVNYQFDRDEANTR